MKTVHTSFPFILAKMAEEEVAKFVVGNDNGTSGYDAPRDCSVTSRRGDCTVIRLNTGKLTRSGHGKDCQIHSQHFLEFLCGARPF